MKKSGFAVFVSACLVSSVDGPAGCFYSFLNKDTEQNDFRLQVDLPTHHHRKHLSVSVRRVSFHERRRGGAKLRGLLPFPGLQVTPQKLPGSHKSSGEKTLMKPLSVDISNKQTVIILLSPCFTDFGKKHTGPAPHPQPQSGSAGRGRQGWGRECSKDSPTGHLERSHVYVFSVQGSANGREQERKPEGRPCGPCRRSPSRWLAVALPERRSM